MPAKQALVGIRPSDIRLAGKGDAAIASKVHLLEPLGDITDRLGGSWRGNAAHGLARGQRQ